MVKIAAKCVGQLEKSAMLKNSPASTQTKKLLLHFCKLVTLVSHFTAQEIILVPPFQLGDRVMTALL